ncbi:(2,3-dihydroxybenzoyl)adenylate synthase [Streptomyces sp. NPDC020883]|uniref:(2,3-dihydroxybenzoyl)adenylate synthase n=1 Tax=Streptomyces sp. NPDC020883 TaxID=3365099 RepID=UPI00378E3EA0
MLAGCVEWPEEFVARYIAKGYWEDRALGTLLRDWADAHAERTALVDGDRRWTYRELDDRADRLAAGFQERGIEPGDRVVVHLPNSAEFVAVCFALFRLGALPVFALPAHRHAEIGYLCEYAGATAYVIPDTYQGMDFRKIAEQVLAEVPTLREVVVAGEPGRFTALDELYAAPRRLPAPDPADVAFFLLSGGTTGLPKLIPRTHRDYAYNVRVSAENAGFTGHTTYLTVLPAAHNYAFGCPGILGTLRAGGKVVLADSGNPDLAFPLIEREGVTVSALVPPLALVWMDAAAGTPHDLSSLELLQVGGARFEPVAAQRMRDRLDCALQQSFGMAEGLLSQTAPDDSEETVTRTQGRPLSPDDEIRLVDGRGRDVPEGRIGLLLVRGPYTLRGYYRAEEHNARDFTEDGFFVTGDLASRTPTGELVIRGRVKDVINRGGEKVSAEEVEGHLLAHPDIRDVGVVAAPDALLGERTCAFVVFRDGPQEGAFARLTDFLHGRGLAEYKIPDRWEAVEELPRTGVGKADKAGLRARAARSAAQRPALRPRTTSGGPR